MQRSRALSNHRDSSWIVGTPIDPLSRVGQLHFDPSVTTLAPTESAPAAPLNSLSLFWRGAGLVHARAVVPMRGLPTRAMGGG
jgi:hypothetical protein